MHGPHGVLGLVVEEVIKERKEKVKTASLSAWSLEPERYRYKLLGIRDHTPFSYFYSCSHGHD